MEESDPFMKRAKAGVRVAWEKLRKIPSECWALPLLIVTVFSLRFLTLLEIPYPPSADAAGDLVWLHTYLGHPLPGYGLLEAPPPDYFFLVVLPSISAFGIFDGIRVIMAMIPALYVVPGYYLIRWSGYGRVAGYAGAVLLSTSAAFSEMVTWNSAFNATGILYLLGLLACLAWAYRTPTTIAAVGSGILLSLVAGTHIVTFLYTLVVIAGFAILTVIVDRRRVRVQLAFLGKTLGIAGLLFLPYAQVYYNNFVITTNVGPPSSGYSLQHLLFVYSVALGLPWGSNGPIPSITITGLVTLIAMMLTILALPLIWRRIEDRFIAMLTTSLFGGAIFLAALDPGNGVRALYFLPIAYVPALVAFVSSRLTSMRLRNPSVTRGARHGRKSSHPIGLNRNAIAICVVVFLALNVVVSQQSMEQSERFYLELSPAKVAVLNWISAHTPKNATFYDGANLQTWLLGYADRLTYSPSDLSSEITESSYSAAFDANLIDLGAYVMGDSRLYITSNVPGVYNSPGLFIRTNGYSDPVWLGESDMTQVTVKAGATTHVVTLNTGESINVSGSVLADGTVLMQTNYHFPTDGFALLESVELQGGATTVSFSSPTATIDGVSMVFRTPPSGYYYYYGAYSNISANGSFQQTLQLPFLGLVTVDTTAPGFRATITTESSGWSSMNLTARGPVTISVSGLQGVPSAVPFFSNTMNLSRALGINYFVVSDLTDYPLYERFFAFTTQGYLTMPVVFVSGDISVFKFS
jgi:hypothetical protein